MDSTLFTVLREIRETLKEAKSVNEMWEKHGIIKTEKITIGENQTNYAMMASGGQEQQGRLEVMQFQQEVERIGLEISALEKSIRNLFLKVPGGEVSEDTFIKALFANNQLIIRQQLDLFRQQTKLKMLKLQFMVALMKLNDVKKGGNEDNSAMLNQGLKGGIDMDTKDMKFSSTGNIDQAILQQLPNIRPQDIIGISITNITVSPIPSLPKLLGMDDSESEESEESLAKMELSYLREE